MIETLSLPRTTSRGAVGARQLVAVQTFDVARLTNHPVPLVPGTFIAVSGQGPKGDSNGSGKTSFLAAVSILLADPQWRLDTQGGKSAAGVLFRPDSAGVDPAQQVRPATNGYIAGVFADREAPLASAVTVWVRLSTSAPYVQARWSAGVHLAEAADDADRDLQADDLWHAVRGNGTFSARKMSEVLYGDAPRCLTYLDTPLRPAVPSLLSQQMTEMDPRDIGESLIALSGSKAHLDEEREQRGQMLLKRRERDEALEHAEGQFLREEAELKGVGDRDAARAELAQAEEAWRRYLATRYTSALGSERVLAEQVTAAADHHEEAAEQARLVEAELAELRARTDLATAEEGARRDHDLARIETERLRQNRAEYVGQMTSLDAERDRLSPKLDAWDGRSTEDTHDALQAATSRRGELVVLQQQAEAAVGSAEQTLRRAEAGRSGDAGRVIDVLAQAGITGTALFDIIELDDDLRPTWEPRLWPWRDAVVVDHQRMSEAMAAVASVAGAQLIATDHWPGHSVDRVSCRLPVNGFLTELRARMVDGADPVHVHDEALGLRIGSGFAEPVTGREALVERKRRELRQAREHLEEITKLLDLAGAAVELAQSQHEAALAAEQLGVVHSKIDLVTAKIQGLDDLLGPAVDREGRARQAWEEAFALLKGHAAQVALLQERFKSRQKDERGRFDQLKAVRRKREDLQLERWRQLWGGDEQEAVDLLADRSSVTADQIRVQAIEHLTRAVGLYGIDERDPDGLSADLREAVTQRQVLAADTTGHPPAVGLDVVAVPLRTRLDGTAGSDHVTRSRIEAERANRAEILQDLDTQLADWTSRVTVIQDMIEQRVENILKRVGVAFNQLDVDRGGCGAEIAFTSHRPAGPGEWVWDVVPRWRRSRSGAYVPYREVANGAQVKVYAVQLVLAALLSDVDTHGRVLVLDELGNSLGEVNRKDVLGALKRVAERQQVTILGTCQDSVLADAADVCGELMWFSHSSTANAYNHPTRVWGFDDNAERVDLTADWLTAGRGNG
ncbi:hypothetical protein [Kutzneria albida]|uniref:Uncharacterized protein n=1 Tax=Kutzneria albida DSM 43870 TaxID=1449976 RepID=W5WDD8_9PSEU|nr:hypothetical protein [Kutzneria albida]AHH98596.1 hypothetical protein KALB_5234 [Kutzneria albida DSM 43870]